jgi:hypothetical protein
MTKLKAQFCWCVVDFLEKYRFQTAKATGLAIEAVAELQSHAQPNY